jgi:hypothetical protein
VACGPLGWQAVAFSEIETFPCSVLANHYHYVQNLGDMTTIARRVMTTHHGRWLAAKRMGAAVYGAGDVLHPEDQRCTKCVAKIQAARMAQKLG